VARLSETPLGSEGWIFFLKKNKEKSFKMEKSDQ